MNDGLLNSEQLSAWCGYSRAADIERWLRENGIPWRRGKQGEPCTTLAAVTQSLLGHTSQSQEATF